MQCHLNGGSGRGLSPFGNLAVSYSTDIYKASSGAARSLPLREHMGSALTHINMAADVEWEHVPSLTNRAV
jgi:hypothetical protein